MAERKRTRMVVDVECTSLNGVQWYFTVGATRYGWCSQHKVLFLGNDEHRRQWGSPAPCLRFAVGYCVGVESALILEAQAALKTLDKALHPDPPPDMPVSDR